MKNKRKVEKKKSTDISTHIDYDFTIEVLQNIVLLYKSSLSKNMNTFNNANIKNLNVKDLFNSVTEYIKKFEIPNITIAEKKRNLNLPKVASSLLSIVSDIRKQTKNLFIKSNTINLMIDYFRELEITAVTGKDRTIFTKCIQIKRLFFLYSFNEKIKKSSDDKKTYSLPKFDNFDDFETSFYKEYYEFKIIFVETIKLLDQLRHYDWAVEFHDNLDHSYGKKGLTRDQKNLEILHSDLNKHLFIEGLRNSDFVTVNCCIKANDFFREHLKNGVDYYKIYISFLMEEETLKLISNLESTHNVFKVVQNKINDILYNCRDYDGCYPLYKLVFDYKILDPNFIKEDSLIKFFQINIDDMVKNLEKDRDRDESFVCEMIFLIYKKYTGKNILKSLLEDFSKNPVLKLQKEHLLNLLSTSLVNKFGKSSDSLAYSIDPSAIKLFFDISSMINDESIYDQKIIDNIGKLKLSIYRKLNTDILFFGQHVSSSEIFVYRLNHILCLITLLKSCKDSDVIDVLLGKQEYSERLLTIKNDKLSIDLESNLVKNLYEITEIINNSVEYDNSFFCIWHMENYCRLVGINSQEIINLLSLKIKHKDNTIDVKSSNIPDEKKKLVNLAFFRKQSRAAITLSKINAFLNVLQQAENQNHPLSKFLCTDVINNIISYYSNVSDIKHIRSMIQNSNNIYNDSRFSGIIKYMNNNHTKIIIGSHIVNNFKLNYLAYLAKLHISTKNKVINTETSFLYLYDNSICLDNSNYISAFNKKFSSIVLNRFKLILNKKPAKLSVNDVVSCLDNYTDKQLITKLLCASIMFNDGDCAAGILEKILKNSLLSIEEQVDIEKFSKAMIYAFNRKMNNSLTKLILSKNVCKFLIEHITLLDDFLMYFKKINVVDLIESKNPNTRNFTLLDVYNYRVLELKLNSLPSLKIKNYTESIKINNDKNEKLLTNTKKRKVDETSINVKDSSNNQPSKKFKFK